MPITLVCQRCGSEMHQSDAFCQECGLAQKKESLPEKHVPVSDFDWPALEADPLKLYDAPPVNRSAEQTYEFANYQLDLEPLAAADPAEKLQSVLIPKAAKSETDNKLGWRGGYAMLAIDLALPAALLCFVTFLSLFGYKQFQIHEKNKSTSLLQSIKKAEAKKDYEMLYKQLSSLPTLSAKQRNLLDQAAYELAESYLAKGEKTKALQFFENVSVESDNYINARGQIFQYGLPEDLVKYEAKNLRVKEAVKAPPLETRKNPSPLPLKQDFKLSEEAVLSIPVIPEIEKSASGDVSAGPTEEQSPAQKFSESEISQYNRLLGKFFAAQRDKEESGAENTTEAPSFKEWLKSGKASF
ncbi:MAG: hypothetical protein K2X27_02990 [Candidatus Obscuribacterales bacterium]|nr:hypothetical protein [Candidatus Obscuribacterales bacterium]